MNIHTIEFDQKGPFLLVINRFYLIWFLTYSFYLLIETPINPCHPSPCGENAICNKHPNREHTATCVCIKGYFGDPFSLCQKPECTLNNNCPTNRVCRNQKCVDPCPGFCGINTVCSVSNHVQSCDCLKGYNRNPTCRALHCKESCKLSKIVLLLIIT